MTAVGRLLKGEIPTTAGLFGCVSVVILLLFVYYIFGGGRPGLAPT